MASMTAPQQVLARLSTEFAALSQQMSRASSELAQLSTAMAQPGAAEPTAWGHPPFGYRPHPYPYQTGPVQAVAPPVTVPAHPQPPRPAPPHPETPPREPRSQNWIGRLLAAAGVAVTLIGVVLLVVLAAQAGLLAPPVRVAAGGVLAAALMGVALWQNRRPGGRTGAIALAATAIATAYIDVIAVTTIYAWVAPVIGLVGSAVIGGGGLMLARRWNSEQLALLVLVPLTVLAPIVVGEVDLLLVAFMLALAAATLPVQLGRDWTWMFGARVAVGSGPVVLALIVAAFDSGDQPWVAGATAIAAVVAIGSAVILLPHSSHRTWLAVLAAGGATPLLVVSAAVDPAIAALMIAALSLGLLAVVLLGDRIPGIAGPVRQVWSALSVAAALVAVAVAFDGAVAAPLLVAVALVVAIAGRHSGGAQLAALVFGAVGGLYYLDRAGPDTLTVATERTVAEAVSVLISSVLVVLYGVAQTWSLTRTRDADTGRILLAGAAVLSAYAVTVFTVTAGVLIGGTGGGFLGGHMAATICWMALASGLFWYAARLDRAHRSVPIGGGLALVTAAVAKLFLFDLGTLDGIFRVAVFIVTGLVLLGIGAGYARMLGQQDQQRPDSALKME